VRTENFKKSASNSSFSPDEIKAKYSMILSQDKDQLWVRVLNPAGRAQEEYIYETEIVFGRRVVKSLVWKKHTEKSAPLLLEFEFSQLDKNDGAFLKWKVKSSSEEVRLNWRDRKVIEK
jgi:hypothetical protein